MKLLYAEDEPAMAEAVTDILNCHNFMVDAVQDGQEARTTPAPAITTGSSWT